MFGIPAAQTLFIPTSNAAITALSGRRSSSTLSSVILLLLAVLLSACAGDTRNAQQAPTPVPIFLPQLNITAHDFSFDMPDTVLPGLLSVKLSNSGFLPHQAMLARLKDGITYDQLLVAFKKGLATGLPMIIPEGGPNTIMAHQSQEVILNLPEGRYIALSFVTDQDGISDLRRGMFKLFSVTGPADTSHLNNIQPSGQITLEDFSFKLPSKLSTGEQLLKVTNQGQQAHEMSLLKLQTGKTMQDARSYLEVPINQAPFEQAGGTTALAPGQSTWLKLDLNASTYLAVCLMPDAQSGKLDITMGMISQFIVE
jgi:hypothetical protein